MNPHGSLAWSPALCSALGVASAAPGAPPGETKGEPPGGPAGAQRRILLVEDDHSIRDALRGILAEEGYAVTTAENGRQALEQLGSGGAPDLIVLDLRMPIMDGWEFRALQKNDPKLAGIPVLAVSADGSAKAAAIDAEAYLRKPLSTDALLGTITRILSDLERRRLLGRLEEAERFAALGRLAASVGHEINNPLAYILSNLRYLSTELRDLTKSEEERERWQEVEEALGDALHGAERVRKIVQALKTLARAQIEPPSQVDLNAVLDRTLEMMEQELRRRARLVKDYGVSRPVMGDEGRLGQVFLNLLLNAVQAIPEGQPESHEIRVTTRQDLAGNAIVEVRDTGHGIAPEILPRIFEPFFTTKEAGEGTGLGLSICHATIEAMGGEIEVQSEPGRGSTFRILLPPLQATS
jgi:signal transduction histidine kinase